MRGEAGPARQGKRGPGIVVSVESWRVDDAPTLSRTQTAVRNLSRLVWLIFVSVFWRERLSRQSVSWGVELRSCIVSVVVEERVGKKRVRGVHAGVVLDVSATYYVVAVYNSIARCGGRLVCRGGGRGGHGDEGAEGAEEEPLATMAP